MKPIVRETRPREGEVGLPPVIIHEVLDYVPLSEQHPGFLTRRGDFQKLKELTGDGKGIKVGIGDTGVDEKHLEGDLSGVRNAKDFTGSRYGYYDRNSHGSHVTGHIGARNDGSGIEGLAANSDLYHAKVLGDNGSGSTRGIAQGMYWLADQGCHIISLSLGGGHSRDIEGACKELSQQGIIINAAMGNSGWRGDGHPGNSANTFGIAAIDYSMKIAPFSSRGKAAMYSGYGVQVLSCSTNGKYARMSGTSMATPDFSGCCALYLSYLLKLGKPLPKNMADLQRMFKPGVKDLGKEGRDVEYGLGFVDLWKIIKDQPAPDPDPDPEPGPSPQEIKGGLLVTQDGGYIAHTSGNLSIDAEIGDKRYEGSCSRLW